MMRAFLRRLRSWIGRGRKPAGWESIGSPSYRRAIRDLYYADLYWGYDPAVRAIRRAAWRGRRALVLHNPASCHDSNIKGWCWLRRQEDLHPPGRLIVQVSTDGLVGLPKKDWWPVEAEDLAADDWECCRRFGGDWRPAGS